MNDNPRFRHFDHLRSFVVVAETLSMTQAAEQLSLTKGAISHQMRILETELGFPLFQPSRRKLSLTQDGLSLYHIAKSNLEIIEAEIESFRHRASEQISIGMATYFAARWLSPRLMRFISTHPDVGLRIQPLIDLDDWHSNNLDMVVRWGNGHWEVTGMTVELVLHSPAYLTTNMATKELIQRKGVTAAIKLYGLLHDREDSLAWEDWFKAAKLQPVVASHNLVIPDPNVRVQAVIDGQGIALYDELIADELREKKLYQYEEVQLDNYGYYLIYRNKSIQRPAIKDFRDWLMSEVTHGVSPAQ